MTTLFDHGDPWHDRLSEYLDGLLSEPETRALEDHLKSCESCRAALVELRAVVLRLHADASDEVPEGAWARTVSRLPTRTPQDARAAGWRVRRASLGLQTGTLRKVTAAAALTITFMGGIWAGAALCLAESAWTPPGWMHFPARPSRPVSPGGERTMPSRPTDSILDEWTPLRRLLSGLDQQLAGATSALANQPGNKALERVVLRLTRERDNLRSLLDSATTGNDR